MSILILGDLHIANHRSMGGPVVRGVNRRCRELVASVRATVEAARATFGVEHVVQLGDFFDTPRQPPAVYDLCLQELGSLGVEWWIIAGNHDLQAFDAPSAVTPFRHYPGFHIFEEITLTQVGHLPFVMVPYTRLSAKSSFMRAFQLSEDLKLPTGATGTSSVIAAHYGIGDHEDREDYVKASWLVDMAQRNQRIFCGHEHQPSAALGKGASGLSEVVGLGSLNHTSFGDRHKPMAQILRPARGRLLQEMIGPRFIRGLPAFHRSNRSFSELDHSLYAEVHPEDVDRAELYKRAGFITDYRIRVPEVLGAMTENGLIPVEEVLAPVSVEDSLEAHIAAAMTPQRIRDAALEIAQNCLAQVKR